jgi:hypothetical protein
MTRLRPLDLERIRHVPGEMLRHRDLRDQLTFDVELLLWHQRAVHEPGVVEGLAVEWQPGDPSVFVEPGLAYDARGRPVHVLARREVTLPATDRVSALLVRFAQGKGEAELAWRPIGSIEPCDGIPLALLDNGEVTARSTGSRSLARPRVGAGETQPEATAWGLWFRDGMGGQALGLEARVDTSAAGFTEVPCYFAWLNWSRPGDVTTTRAQPDVRTLGLQYVQEETARGFVFRVAFRRYRGEDELLGFARRERLSVCWLGVQCDHDTRGMRERRDVTVR